LPRYGRPKVLNEREEREIMRNFLTVPGSSCKSIAMSRTKSGNPVSERTVGRTARSYKLIPRAPIKGRK